MKYDINLLPNRGPRAAKRLIEFIANYVRYALVISLLAVIIIFFLRMQVDQQLIDAKEKLTLKKSIVEATKGLQEDLNTIQAKIKMVQGALNKQDLFVEKYEYVNSVIPARAKILSISINDKQVIITGNTVDYRLIQQFLARLRKDGRFDTVKLDSIARDTSGKYSFSMTLGVYKKSTKLTG